ncbi:tRNA (adenine(58)-N(1))-methyltransferase catalytic subunit trmt61a [Chytridiales sp. JEL 0842]|nr:tRNA (adenine(58)-N(1))-methyltransferase catalytic subunit trmt61a [Chytridiales sp. JEL 0842]
MSPFTRYKKVMEEGDMVIAYLSPEQMTPFTIKKGEKMNNRFGSFTHDNMIGKDFGSQVMSDNGKGFIYLLHPTPELWTLVLPHRTQILYLADISLVSSMLDLRPGSVVVESGTGSGSFSHSIARSISPSGKLYTFEYHKERADKARSEFESHGLSEIITVNHRDVCKNGFGLEAVADAVFLDLPSPWEAVEAAKAALKKNKVGRVCTFSPCIEQVQRTCATLAELGFFDIRMFESLQRPHEIKQFQSRPTPRRRVQIPKAKSETTNGTPTTEGGALGKRKAEDEGGPVETVNGSTQEEQVEGVSRQSFKEVSLPTKVEPESKELLTVSRVVAEVKGHTSYLVFASVIPV